MPRVDLIDYRGVLYRIDTLDLERLRAWLGEWLPRLHASPGTPASRLFVWPLFDQAGKPDWPADSRFAECVLKVTGDDPHRVMNAIQAERQRIEREIAARR
jgi:hypothetical protein